MHGPVNVKFRTVAFKLNDFRDWSMAKEANPCALTHSAFALYHYTTRRISSVYEENGLIRLSLPSVSCRDLFSSLFVLFSC